MEILRRRRQWEDRSRPRKVVYCEVCNCEYLDTCEQHPLAVVWRSNLPGNDTQGCAAVVSPAATPGEANGEQVTGEEDHSDSGTTSVLAIQTPAEEPDSPAAVMATLSGTVGLEGSVASSYPVTVAHSAPSTVFPVQSLITTAAVTSDDGIMGQSLAAIRAPTTAPPTGAPGPGSSSLRGNIFHSFRMCSRMSSLWCSTLHCGTELVVSLRHSSLVTVLAASTLS